VPRNLLLLTPLRRFGDEALLLMRLAIGAFIVWGVWDNVTSAEHMGKFIAFQRQFGFPYPEFMAPLSVYGQLLMGLAIFFGLFTRWAGLIFAFHFVVAIAMVDHHQGLRGSLPSLCLVLMGLFWGTYGAGRYSLDAVLERRLPGPRRGLTPELA
jgi:putative oxidoreductase